MNDDYYHVTENCDWLEDKGCCSRHYIGDEESVWVCNECEMVIFEDPTEHDCNDGEF